MKKLLITRTDHIGDHILFSGCLPYIRDKFKDWEITLVCEKNVIPLYDLCPLIDEVLDINSHYRKDYDIAINPLYSRTLISDNITLSSGAKETMAFIGNTENIPVNQIDKYKNNNLRYTKLIDIDFNNGYCKGDNDLEIWKYYYLLESLGIDISLDLTPQVWIKPGSYSKSGDIVICCGGAWSYKYVFRIGSALNPFISDDTKIIALGTGSEWAVNQENLDQIERGKKINLSGETTLLQAMQIINNCKVFVGTDSGLAHVACALNKDNIVVIGGGHPGRFFPYSSKTRLVKKEKNCYGCRWICHYNPPHDCLKIPAEDISKQIAEVLPVVKKKAVKKRKHSGIVLSVIVSLFHSEKYLKGLMEDLINQTIFKNTEIILVDSGNSEVEKNIIWEYQKKYNNIFYINLGYDSGIYHAWNIGISGGRGKYITNANTDDRHRKDCFEVMVNALEENPDKALAYAGFYLTEKENDTFEYKLRFWKPQKFDKKLLHRNCYIGPAPVWRKELHEKYGYFDESFLSAGDWEFWLRVAQKEKFLPVEKILGLYLLSPDSREHRDKNLAKKEAGRVYRRYNKS